jgi:hypothetical protein
MIIFTNVYKPIHGTERMIRSFERFGYRVVVGNTPTGNGFIMRDLYHAYKQALNDGHESFCYSDAADTICQRPFDMPKDMLIWSTEKACYPDTTLCTKYKYREGYDGDWRYLNNGVYGGSLELVVEFFEKYQLHKLHQHANGQHEVMLAYLDAVDNGFPIKLDIDCEYFQSIAFDYDPERKSYPLHQNDEYHGVDFELVNGMVHNRVTGTTPAILHGNGLTPMGWIEKNVL